MRVRQATVTDRAAVMNIFDGGLLAIDDEVVTSHLEHENVFVAIENSRILGALLLEDATVLAIAVRPNRRGTGIGTELIEAACAAIDADSHLTAEFDNSVRPFYEATGFEITSIGPDRSRGHKYS